MTAISLSICSALTQLVSYNSPARSSSSESEAYAVHVRMHDDLLQWKYVHFNVHVLRDTVLVRAAVQASVLVLPA